MCCCSRLLRLQSELSTRLTVNAQLEAELEKQSASAASRLMELQDSYTAKVCAQCPSIVHACLLCV